MDQAVATAYGWNDLDLGYGFHETKQGIRYTISEPVLRSVLDHFLPLNNLRPAEDEGGGAVVERDNGDRDEGEEGAPDSGVPAGGTYFPSSMGLSFVVSDEAKEIVVEAEWGQYLRVKSDTQNKKDGSAANVWKRNRVVSPPIVLSLKDETIEPFAFHAEHPLVQLQGRMRLTVDGWVVTFFMVNHHEERTPLAKPKAD